MKKKLLMELLWRSRSSRLMTAKGLLPASMLMVIMRAIFCHQNL